MLDKIKSNINLIEQILGYKFKDKNLLINSFIRKNYADENNLPSNVALLIAGSKTLDFHYTKKMINKYYPKEETIYPGFESFENDKIKRYKFFEVKSNFMDDAFLGFRFDKLNLNEYIPLSNLDIQNHLTEAPSVKSEILKALIGAIAFDSNWNIKIIDDFINRICNIDKYIEMGIENHNIHYDVLITFWYMKNYKDYFHFNIIDIGADSYRASIYIPLYTDKVYIGRGQTQEECINNACREIFFELKEKGINLNFSSLFPKDINLENGVKIIAKLVSDGYIKKPVYQYCHFNYNEPIWRCECAFQASTGWYSIYAYDEDKNTAKKKATYNTLCEIFGFLNKYFDNIPGVYDGEYNRNRCLIDRNIDDEYYLTEKARDSYRKQVVNYKHSYDYTIDESEQFPFFDIRNFLTLREINDYCKELQLTEEEFQLYVNRSVLSRREEYKKIMDEFKDNLKDEDSLYNYLYEKIKESNEQQLDYDDYPTYKRYLTENQVKYLINETNITIDKLQEIIEKIKNKINNKITSNDIFC